MPGHEASRGLRAVALRLTISRCHDYMKRVITSNMYMRNFTLHRRRQIRDGEMIGHEQRICMSFKIGLLEFD